MKVKIIGMVVLGFIFGSSAIAKTVGNDGVIDSVYSLESLLVESRFQYLPVSPPTSDPYVDIRENVLPVDWKAFKNKTFTSQMYAEMSPDGFPIYRVGVRQDFWTGETVFYNSYEIEILRLAPTEQDYDPYAWAKDYFQVSSVAELSEMQQLLYPSSKIELEVYLLPEIFFSTYQEIEAEQVALELAMQEVSAPVAESDSVTVGIAVVSMETIAVSSEESDEFMMAMASSSPPPPGGGGGTNSVPGGGSSNLVVELAISLPAGFVNNYIGIFTKEELVYSPNWTLADSWIPTYGEQTVYWIDPLSSNKTQRFYLIDETADSDGDGRSDLYEEWNGTASNVFNIVDSDSDGMHDWWEEKLFGGLSQDGDDDFDGDGLLNNEELVPGQPPVMITDPSLYSSDGDVLGDAEMYATPPTDPWDGDADKPSASILYPTNNTVVAF